MLILSSVLLQYSLYQTINQMIIMLMCKLCDNVKGVTHSDETELSPESAAALSFMLVLLRFAAICPQGAKNISHCRFREHIYIPDFTVTVFLQVSCPVRTSTLLSLADMRSTSAVVRCAATLRTCCRCSSSWQDPTLTCKSSATVRCFREDILFGPLFSSPSLFYKHSNTFIADTAHTVGFYK